MFISQVCPAPLYTMPYSGETSSTGLSGGHKELADLPLTSQEEGIQAHVYLLLLSKPWHANGRFGEGGLARNQLLLFLCAVKESMCVPACVCAWAWTEREDEVMIPTLNSGQLTFPWRFLIKANVCPTKQGSLGGWHLISSKNTHRHTSQIKAIYYLLQSFLGSISLFWPHCGQRVPFLSVWQVYTMLNWLAWGLGFSSLGRAELWGGDREGSHPFGF